MTRVKQTLRRSLFYPIELMEQMLLLTKQKHYNTHIQKNQSKKYYGLNALCINKLLLI